MNLDPEYQFWGENVSDVAVGIACPKCHERAAKVLDSRQRETEAFGEVCGRRRECTTCGHRWKTVEVPVRTLLRLDMRLRENLRAKLNLLLTE